MRRLLLMIALLVTAQAVGHEQRLVGSEGEQQYELVVGMLNEPVFTGLRTGLDLTVSAAPDGSPVEGLENSLQVTITAPTGESRVLELRARHGMPGAYTDDYVLTMPGTYDIRIEGFIGDLDIDETFPREVRDASEITFP